ncbi:MAG: class I SAM-dependent methyltransferase [Rickettsiales bacterium]|jgi:O-methyltransferase involved in polyketide biosynthesis|nr:class I SAM-dependent methyltransferase [Rickettsiales bacterium]
MLHPRTLTDIPYSVDIFNQTQRIFPNNVDVTGYKVDDKNAIGYEARYKLIDKMLAKTRITQVLELASGFSQRGLIFTENENVQYVEMDLPKMAEMKRQVLNGIGKMPENLHIIGGNALRSEDFEKAADPFDISKPVAVVHEGLLRYLSFDEKKQVARNVYKLLEKFGGVWITCDITMSKYLESQSKNIPRHDANLSKISGKEFEANAFSDTEHAKQFFGDLGFEVELHPFSEIQDKLTSPEKIGLSKQETSNLIQHAVVGVFRCK